MTENQEVVIVGSDGTEHVFPPGFDPKRAAAIVSGESPQQASNVPAAMTASGIGAASLPIFQRIAEQAATSPNLPKIGAAMGRVGGAVAPMLIGGYDYGARGALGGLLGAAQGSWLGGRTGWFTGKLLRDAAGPVASGLERVAPAMGALGAAASAGAASDPRASRLDTGILGDTTHIPGQQPAALNALYEAIRQRLGARLAAP